MIEPELARRFIEQVTQFTEYNINIMDENGVIIASRDPGRIGTYHEVADRIVKGTGDVIVIRDDRMFPGVLPGINMAIMHEGRKEGVVGVTGDPDKIRDVAMITRMAMEAMLKYEKQQESIRLRRSRKEHFINLLTQVEFASPTEIRGIARQLEYEESLVRVPILCRIKSFDTDPGTDSRKGGNDRNGRNDRNDRLSDPSFPPRSDLQQVVDALRRGKGHHSQDLSFILDETHILVFKTIRADSRHSFVDYRREIGDYLEYTLRWLRERKTAAVFYIGTLQNSFSQYYYACRHCKWLESHVGETGEIVFFMDHLKEYFRTLVPRQELQRVFHVCETMLDKSPAKQFSEMTAALEETNYNLTKAAQMLYVHKNTLVYRYNKMKDYLGIDPLERSQDRTFLELLHLYLEK